MFIPANIAGLSIYAPWLFQSLDWVDVYSGIEMIRRQLVAMIVFQSLDWVDVYSGRASAGQSTVWAYVSIPRLG